METNEEAAGTIISLRVDKELEGRINAYLQHLNGRTAGVFVSRASALRALILKGLEEVGYDVPR